MTNLNANRITFAVMAAMLLIVFFGSCTPQKRLNRLVKHHPELVKDSIHNVPVAIVSKGLHADTTIDLKQLFPSLFFNNEIDKSKVPLIANNNSTADTITITKNNYYPSAKKLFKSDTLRYTQNKVSVKLFLNGNELGIRISTPTDTLHTIAKVPEKNIINNTPPPNNKWTWRMFGIGIALGIIIMLLLLYLTKKVESQ